MSLTEYTVRDYGHVTKYYKKDTNVLHRIGGPAIEYMNGHKEWWQNNILHREEKDYKGETLPAIYYSGRSSVAYYRHGVLHREHGPALKLDDGLDHNNRNMYIDYHYHNGKLHNLNGPAVYGGNVFRYFVDDNETNQINHSKEVEIYKNITLKTASIRDYIGASLLKNPN